MPKTHPMKVRITKISQVIPGPEGFSSEHNHAKGRIEIPDWAKCTWSTVEGPSWSWTEDAHFHEATCPVCMETSACTQNVTVWPREKILLVVHNYQPPSLS